MNFPAAVYSLYLLQFQVRVEGLGNSQDELCEGEGSTSIAVITKHIFNYFKKCRKLEIKHLIHSNPG